MKHTKFILIYSFADSLKQMKEKLIKLIHKKGSIKEKITRFKSYFYINQEQQDINQLKLRLLIIEGLHKGEGVIIKLNVYYRF